MKRWGLPSSNRLPHHIAFSAAALFLSLVMATASFGSTPEKSSAQKEDSTLEEGSTPKEGTTPEEGGTPEEGTVLEGKLILEDPTEKTRYAEYAMAVGDSFSITFIHSVNKSPVTDYFELREDGIYGIKTVYYGFGAGVPTELEEGQTLTYGEDGSMIISGFNVKLDNLIYRVGTVSDHTLVLEGKDEEEISLRDLCGRSARVGFRFEI